jgi:small subunit ribosomal protein S8
MNMTDPVADMLTRIRNAVRARHTRVAMPASKLKLAIARVLKEEGYISDIEIIRDSAQGTLRLTLRYVEKQPVLTQLKRVSKPGLRVYTKKANIPRVRGGQGIAFFQRHRAS